MACCALSWHFLMMNGVAHLFIFLLGHLYILLCDVSRRFTHKKWVVSSSFKNSLYVWGASPLPDTSIEKMSSVCGLT